MYNIITYCSYNIIHPILGTGFIKDIVTLASSIGIGAIVYVTIIILLKVEEVGSVINKIKKLCK